MSTTKEIVWPEVPDFHDYGHANHPNRATEVQIGMVYEGHFGVSKVTGRYGKALEIETFDVVTGKWERCNTLVAPWTLDYFTEASLERAKAWRQNHLVRLEREAQQRREHKKTETKRAKLKTELEVWLGIEIQSVLTFGNGQVSIYLDPKEIARLRKANKANKS